MNTALLIARIAASVVTRILSLLALWLVVDFALAPLVGRALRRAR